MSIYHLLTYLSAFIGLLLVVAALGSLFRHRHSPAGTMAWLLAIVLIPYAGVPLYLLLGGRKVRRAARRKPPIRLTAGDCDETGVAGDMDRLARNLGLPASSSGNRTRLHRNGEESFRALINLIDGARESIFIEAFILHDDAVGREVIAHLARRAGEGLTVRVLLDGLGSFYTKRRRLQPIVEAGGRVEYFNPLWIWPIRSRTQLRNHRKIFIADERLVMAGGANIGLEYMGPEPDPRRWRDLTFELEGPAVRHFTEIFRSDWQYASGETLTLHPGQAGPLEGTGQGGRVQVVPSGPDIPGDGLYNVILSAAFTARERLWIASAYFVPDDMLTHALALAALRGVDVRVLVPARSNHVLTDIARGPYLREVQKAGGQVLLYTGSMMHAKVMLVDDSLAMVGSANMDLRSLYFNYEAAVFSYNPADAAEVEDWMRSVETRARPGLKPAGHLQAIYEGVVRLIAPLL